MKNISSIGFVTSHIYMEGMGYASWIIGQEFVYTDEHTRDSKLEPL